MSMKMSDRKKIEKLDELIKGSIVGEIVEQSVESLVPPGENFGSVLYKVDFNVKNGGRVETYNAVAKCTPPNEVSQELFNIQVTTKAEIAWYTTVIPTIKQFQREHGIEVADFFQHFYGARINLDPSSDIVDLDGLILTENLNPLGYHNIDRHIGFDLKTTKSILRDLATFHAVPIAIKMKDKELFEKNIRPYLPNYEIKEDPSAKPKDPFKDIRESLMEIPEIAPFIHRVVTNIEKNNKLSSNATTPKEPWGSVCHNDFWINNIMVKEEDDPKIVFLDFQIAAYGSIAIDVLFFLVVSVSLEVVTESMDELIAYYWDQFLQNLKRLGCDRSLYNFEEFLKEIDFAASTGQFGHAFFHNYIMLRDKGETHIDSSNKDFKKEDFQKNRFGLNSRHKEKYKWFINEFAKRGWI